MTLVRLIVLICVRVFVVSLNDIQIVGLFPKSDQCVSDVLKSHNTMLDGQSNQWYIN